MATRSKTQLPEAASARADIVSGAGLDQLPTSAAIIACCNFPYSAAGWEACWPPAIDNLILLAEKHQATLVVVGNYYCYPLDKMPMRASDPLAPPSSLGKVRAEVSRRLFTAHEAGRIQAVEVRGSTYFGADAGPLAYIGPRFIDSLLTKGVANVIGNPDLPHTLTAIPDFGRLLARAATDKTMAGRAWHVPSAPATSIRELATLIMRTAGKSGEPRLRIAPKWAMRAMAVFSPTMRAICATTLAQASTPFIADDSVTRELLGETHTPMEETVAAIVQAHRPSLFAPDC